jgi:transposase
MPKRLNFHLDMDELAPVEHAMHKDKRPEVRQRATAIHLLHLGHKPAAVGAMLSVTEQAIYQWHRRYRQGGLAALANQPKGRPQRKADAAYLQLLEATLAQEPSVFGYTFAIWTVERLRDHLAQVTGVQLSISRLRTLLRQQDYVYRRPKHDLSNLQDQQAKAAAQAQLAEIKKGREQVIANSSLWTRRR